MPRPLTLMATRVRHASNSGSRVLSIQIRAAATGLARALREPGHRFYREWK
jgi:hypothetical protein